MLNKKAPHFVESNFLANRNRQKNIFAELIEEGQIYLKVPQIFHFFLGPSDRLSKLSDNFTRFFRL